MPLLRQIPFHLTRFAIGSLSRLPFALLFLVGWATVVNAGWFFEQRISPGDMSCYLNSRSITTDWRDEQHVVYSYYQGLRYIRYDGFSWVDDRHLDYGTSAQIAADPAGDIHVVWRCGGDGRLCYQRRGDLGWTEVETISQGSVSSPTVVSDAYGVVHVAWTDEEEEDVYTRRWDGLTWSPIEGLTSAFGFSAVPLLASDGNGKVHLAWYDDRDGLWSLYYKLWDGSAWQGDELIVPGAGSGGFSIACDSADRVHIVWTTDSPTDTDLHWIMKDEDGWSEDMPLVVGPGNVGSPSLAAAPGGALELLWDENEFGGGVHHAAFDGSIWSGFERLPTGQGTSENPSLAVCSDGSLAAIYVGDRMGNTDVYFMPRREIPPPRIDALEPPFGHHGNHAGVRLIGEGFLAPDSVWIERPGQLRILGQVVDAAPEVITCDFDLTDALLGSWDLVLQNPDGQRARVDGGYEIRASVAWTPAMRITWSEGPVGSVAAAAAPGGTGLHVVWTEELGAPRRLYYQAWNGTDWTAPIRIDEGDSLTDVFPSQLAIAVDRRNHVHVVWRDQSTLIYRSFDGNEWSPGIDLSDPALNDVMAPAVAIDSQDRLFVCYRQGWSLGAIYCRVLDQGVWSPAQEISVGSSMFTDPALAADNAGSVHAVWWDAWSNQAFYRRWDGSTWSSQDIIPLGWISNSPSLQLAVDVHGRVHLLWSNNSVMDAWSEGSGWSMPEELGGCGLSTSACTDSDMNIQLVYACSGEIRHQTWDGSIWTDEKTLQQGSAYMPLIRGDTWGNEHLLWISNQDGDAEVYYRRRGAPLPAPEIQAVDPTNAPAFGTVDVTVTGAHFFAPCQVDLLREGYESIPGTTIESEDDHVRSRFDLTGVGPGTWGVLLISADGQRDTLSASFTLTESPWGPETRISHADHASSLAFNAGRSLLWGIDGRLHLLWYDGRDGNYEIYWTAGTQAGWSPETRLTQDPGASIYPVAAQAAGGPIVLAWQESRDGNWEIYSETYAGGGWSSPQRLTTNVQPSQVPCLAADAIGNVHLVWQDGRGGNLEVYYKKWNGTWEAGERRISDDSGSSLYPTAVSDGLGRVYVAWMDDRDGNWEIYYEVFDGETWGDETRLTEDPGESAYPSLASDGEGTVYVVWMDDRDGSLEVYGQRLDETSTPERLTQDPGASTDPMLLIAPDGTRRLVWTDDRREGISQIWYKTWTGGQWSLDHRMSDSPMGADLPMITGGTGGTSQIIWRDSRDGNFEIYGLFPGMGDPASAPGMIEGSEVAVRWLPNPFNREVSAIIELPAPSITRLDLFDLAGRRIRTLLDNVPTTHRATVFWDGRDEGGRPLRAGVFFYRLRAGDCTRTGTLIRVR